MKNAVIIKSFPNGLNVILNDEIPFDGLLEEIRKKFSENSKFFKNAPLAVSFSGRQLSDSDENAIVDAISESCDINITCLILKDPEKNTFFIKAMESLKKETRSNKSQIFKGSLKSGQNLEVAGSLIILGDINPGASVIAGGNIIVLGTLYGSATCGAAIDITTATDRVSADGTRETDDSPFIVALDMKPSSLTVNGFKAKLSEKGFRIPILSKSSPQIAYEKNGKVEINALSKEFLANLPF